jgi:ribonuclease HI
LARSGFATRTFAGPERPAPTSTRSSPTRRSRSPHEAEYHALIRGLKLAAEKRLPYVAAFSDSANVVNQITRRWNKNERATELYEEVEEALEPFKAWQLSWVPREMNREADKLVDQAFKGEPVIHATD